MFDWQVMRRIDFGLALWLTHGLSTVAKNHFPSSTGQSWLAAT